MDLYVLQCFSGKEDLVRKKLLRAIDQERKLPSDSSRKSPDDSSLRIIIPRREMKIRRGGENQTEEYLLFPGYIFIENPSIDSDILRAVRSVPEALRFLPENSDIRPLYPGEREIILRLVLTGEIIGESQVRFDENRRIEVIRGPMEGLEGRIIKVNRRKGRAKVRLDMYDRTFEVDFSFSDLAKAESADDNSGSDR